MVGGSFTAMTVTTKVSVSVPAGSLTVTVIVAVPAWLATGVTVTIRAPPVPPKESPEDATRSGLLELPDSAGAREVNPVMENAIALVLVSSVMDWSEMEDMTGAAAAGTANPTQVRAITSTDGTSNRITLHPAPPVSARPTLQRESLAAPLTDMSARRFIRLRFQFQAQEISRARARALSVAGVEHGLFILPTGQRSVLAGSSSK